MIILYGSSPEAHLQYFCLVLKSPYIADSSVLKKLLDHVCYLVNSDVEKFLILHLFFTIWCHGHDEFFIK